MNVDRARFLVSPRGQSLLAEHATLDATDPVRVSARLRMTLAPEEAAAIAEQLALRAAARKRFDAVPNLLFTSNGLEMMTHPLVAARRAMRLAGSGRCIVDLGCSIGGDLRFFAEYAAAAGLERDPATALLADANVPRAAVVRGDATALPFDLRRHAIFLDPSRRDGARRTFDPAAYSPPWDACLMLASQAERAAIKTAPGIPAAAILPGAEVEFVQLGRSLREATLWLGDGAAPGLRRAVLLPSGAELTSASEEAQPDPAAVGAFVIDPESCVTRAGLVRHLGAAVGARLVDPSLAYLTSDVPAVSPLAATFEVVDRVDFSLHRLRNVLRNRRWSPAEIRRRAFPVEPDELRRLLGRLPGEPVTLLCTTIAGERTVLIGRRIDRRENCAPV